MNRFETEDEEVLDGGVTLFENSAYVIVPRRWRGFDVNVVRTAEPTEEEE